MANGRQNLLSFGKGIGIKRIVEKRKLLQDEKEKEVSKRAYDSDFGLKYVRPMIRELLRVEDAIDDDDNDKVESALKCFEIIMARMKESAEDHAG